MKLVTDGNKYCIRKGWFVRRWFDFKCPGYWWNFNGIGTKFFNDCWTDERTAKMWFKRLKQ